MTPDETRTAIAEELHSVRQALARIGARVEDLCVQLEEAAEREAQWQDAATKRLKDQVERRR